MFQWANQAITPKNYTCYNYNNIYNYNHSYIDNLVSIIWMYHKKGAPKQIEQNVWLVKREKNNNTYQLKIILFQQSKKKKFYTIFPQLKKIGKSH